MQPLMQKQTSTESKIDQGTEVCQAYNKNLEGVRWHKMVENGMQIRIISKLFHILMSQVRFLSEITTSKTVVLVRPRV